MPVSTIAVVESYGKSSTGFKSLGTSLEPDHMDLGTNRTPVESFFVCSGAPAPLPSDWSLTLDGDAAGEVRTLTLADLEALPQQSVDSWLECAGNGRAMYELVGGYPRPEEANDTAWTLGSMGMATWTGPRLSDVINLARPTGDLAWIGPTGMDVENLEGEPVRMSLPATKALHPDTLVALGMNDEPLVPAHGAPARLLVPGWIGAYSVKWIDRLELSTTWVSSYRSDEYYVRRTADGTKLGPATTHPLKSTVALPFGATIAAGQTETLGYARGGDGPIVAVEFSVDDGDWMPCTLLPLASPWAWTPFRFEWTAEPGERQVRTRAVTASGETQPDTVPYNPHTILWNAVTPHRVLVRA